MASWIGKRLGRVQIESLLARGGMAEVYLGTHTTLQRKVAVKILRNQYGDDAQLLERFEREARAVAKLRHPNIVQVFDFDTVEDQPYLVMEYIPGPPLSKYLATIHARNDRLGLPLISRLLTQIAAALQYAHKHGVIHRDVKPGNILLSSRSIQIVPGETLPLDLEPVLTDFGLVRFLNSSRQTASGLIIGTPTYMSPEQAGGQATDERTDIYSLGIVLYEMLSGKVPFEAESTISILLKHINESPPPIPGLSPALQSVLDRALAKNPNDRFSEPEEFAAAFNAALDGTSDANTLVALPQVLEVAKANKIPPSTKTKPTRGAWTPAILVGLLISLFAGSLLWNGMTSPTNGETPTFAAVTISDTPMLVIPVTFGPTGELHFQDGDAILDRANLSAQVMPAAPAGGQYEVWLVNGQERLSLGILHLDENGRGELTFDDPQNRNLLADYQGVEITIESNTGLEPNSPANIAYSYALPDSGIAYLHALMVSFPGTPEQGGLIQGLHKDTKLIDEAGREMLSNYENGNEAGTRKSAESIMNLLVGNQSPDHKDWNGDGQITDPGDGYGFLLNGNNLGYVQAVYSYADYAINSPGASQNMIINGKNVKDCSENLARWTPELRQHISTILGAATGSATAEEIQRSADLANQILNGIDKNENGEIEPISDECGVVIAHEATYHMADMPLLPVAVNPSGTVIAVSETVTPSPTFTVSSPLLVTSTKPQSQSGGQVTVAPTQQPPAPTSGPHNPNPTRGPRPTHNPGPPHPKPTKNHP